MENDNLKAEAALYYEAVERVKKQMEYHLLPMSMFYPSCLIYSLRDMVSREQRLSFSDRETFLAASNRWENVLVEYDPTIRIGRTNEPE